MATVSENKQFYESYNWALGGLEWSCQWGSTSTLWRKTLEPRLASYLPAARTVEIGCGHGRISEWLATQTTEHLYLFDIIEHCIDACAKRFENKSGISCLLADGSSLPGISDSSVDLIVSFYSLVHANRETVEAYVTECERVLSANGVVFLHHSNAGAYYRPESAETDDRQRLLAKYRDTSMSATCMREIAEENNLSCIYQECVNWDVEEILADCFSTLVRPDSHHDRVYEMKLNHQFRREMHLAKQHSTDGECQ